MNASNRDGRIRLVSLLGNSSGTPRPLQDCNRLMDLAIEGKAHLYVRVPPGTVAYVDPKSPLVTTAGNIRRIPSIHSTRLMHLTPAETLRPGRTKERKRIHPEVTFLALDCSHAETLKATMRVSADCFPSGLAQHRNAELRRRGWMAPCLFSSALRFCTIEQAAEDPMFMVPVLSETVTLRLERMNPVKPITLEDVFIDEQSLSVVENSAPSLREDPHRLYDRARNVYYLYCAAARYYTLLKKRAITADDVESWIQSTDPELYNEKTAWQAVKLINPNSRRGSGIPTNNQVTFNADVLASMGFEEHYMRGSFVTEALALILFVTDWWLAERPKLQGIPNKRADREYVDDKLKLLGFYDGDELESVRRIVIWPHL